LPEKVVQTLQSSTDLTKSDITYLTIECRSWAGKMFRIIARKDGDVTDVYSRFIELFYQLWTAFKFNAAKTNKIDDWDKLQKLYDSWFDQVLDGAIEPKKALKMFEALQEDLIKCGIYDLTQGDFIGDKGV